MEWKTVESIADLQPGTIVRGKLSGRRGQVIANYGSRAAAVEVLDITNPPEWEMLTRDGADEVEGREYVPAIDAETPDHVPHAPSVASRSQRR